MSQPLPLYVLSVRWPEINGSVLYNTEKVETILRDNRIDWLRFNSSTWFLRGAMTAFQLQELLRATKLLDEFVLLEALPASRAGWTKTWIWDWIFPKQ
jgi:hypothetical protein